MCSECLPDVSMVLLAAGPQAPPTLWATSPGTPPGSSLSCTGPLLHWRRVKLEWCMSENNHASYRDYTVNHYSLLVLSAYTCSDKKQHKQTQRNTYHRRKWRWQPAPIGQWLWIPAMSARESGDVVATMKGEGKGRRGGKINEGEEECEERKGLKEEKWEVQVRRECVEVEEGGEGAIRMNLADFHRVWRLGELFIQL